MITIAICRLDVKGGVATVEGSRLLELGFELVGARGHATRADGCVAGRRMEVRQESAVVASRLLRRA